MVKVVIDGVEYTPEPKERAEWNIWGDELHYGSEYMGLIPFGNPRINSVGELEIKYRDHRTIIIHLEKMRPI